MCGSDLGGKDVGVAIVGLVIDQVKNGEISTTMTQGCWKIKTKGKIHVAGDKEANLNRYRGKHKSKQRENVETQASGANDDGHDET